MSIDDVPTGYLYAMIVGYLVGVTFAFTVNAYAMRSWQRQWHGAVRRLLRARRVSIEIESSRIGPLDFVAHVKLNGDYVSRFYIHAEAPLTVRIINANGDEIIPDAVEMPAGGAMH